MAITERSSISEWIVAHDTFDKAERRHLAARGIGHAELIAVTSEARDRAAAALNSATKKLNTERR